MFEAKHDKNRLDKLTANLNELQINNLKEIIDIYITERFIDELQDRVSTENANPNFEWKMRWIAEFWDFVKSLLKDEY